MAAGTRQVTLPPQRNLLTNPGFEVKQRIATSFTVSGQYTLDQWYLALTGSATATVSQIASTIGAPGNSAQLAYTHAASGAATLIQKFESFAQLRGRQVTFAATVKSTVSGTVRLYLYDGFTTTLAAYNVGTGSQRLVVTATLSASTTQLLTAIHCDVASCTVEVNDATLCTGGVAMEYEPLHAADDLARCKRYYQIYNGGNAMQLIGYQAAGGAGAIWGVLSVAMMGTPTVTKNGTFFVSNCGQPTFTAPDNTNFGMLVTVTALGTFQCNTFAGAGATVTFESNP